MKGKSGDSPPFYTRDESRERVRITYKCKHQSVINSRASFTTAYYVSHISMGYKMFRVLHDHVTEICIAAMLKSLVTHV